ncbi:MAG TPA: ABC transporter ATP-binding protein [Acidimicrobiales bacterium]|nr:ABC transporter ATP-binding protein [Acidimicrobiales bacterium]
MTPLLSVSEVTVRFGGLSATRDVDLELDAGVVGALIGPNGAGKTTMFNVITGAQAVSAGHVHFAGTDITSAPPVRRARMGMARTFQNLSLVPTLTALENVGVGVGRFRRTGLPGALLRLPSTRRTDQAVHEIALGALEFVGLGSVAARSAGELSYGDRRRLELARALAMRPRLLLLDEPTAGMGPAETDELAATIRRATSELGIAVLVVEHDMSFVRALATRTTVLEFGSVIATGATDDVLANPRVAAAYLGSAA